MKRVHQFLSSLLLAAAIVAPTAIIAAPAPQGVTIRVYDRDHRDYHNWDDREDRAYRNYLVEQHRSYREYNRQNSRAQRNYWAWRHKHGDRD